MEHDPIEALYARANEHGVAMSRICDAAGVARSTPSRWRNSKNGASMTVLRRLNEKLDELIVTKRKRAPEAPSEVRATRPSAGSRP